MGGTYNVSIYDACRKALNTALIRVECPERIPPSNFTFGLLAKTGNQLRLGGSVCTNRPLEYRWLRLRTPSTTTTATVTGDYELSVPMTEVGVHEYSWNVWDGCNVYHYNTSVHWDGDAFTLLPASTPEERLEWTTSTSPSRTLSECSRDQPLLRFALNDGSTVDVKSSIYRVAYSGSGEGSYQTSGAFPSIAVKAVGSVVPSSRAPQRQKSVYSWQFNVPADKVIVARESSGVDMDYYVAPRAWFPDWKEPETAFTRTNQTTYYDPDYSIFEWTGQNYATPRNRPANYWIGTTMTRGVDAVGNQTLMWNSTTTRTMAIDLSDSRWNSMPLCRMRVSPVTGKPLQIVVSPAVRSTAGLTGDWALAPHAICHGDYTVTLLASVDGTTCAQNISQTVTVGCGLAPDLVLSPDNNHIAQFNYATQAATATLMVHVGDPFYRLGALSVYWRLISGPPNATVTFTNTGEIESKTFSADLPGRYLINITASKGCALTSVTEFVDVFCPAGTALPTAVFEPFAVPSIEYTGALPTLVLSSVGTVVATVPPNPYRRRWSIVSGPAPLGGDVMAGSITNPVSPPETTSQFTPYGGGNYVLGLVVDQGCGERSAQVTQPYTLTCLAATFTVNDVQTTVTYAVGMSVPLIPSATNAYTNPYTSSPTLRHTWVDEEGNRIRGTSTSPSVTPSAQRVFQPKRAGTYRLKYYLDDGCTQATPATHTVVVNCVADPLQIFASTTSFRVGESVTYTLLSGASLSLTNLQWTVKKAGSATPEQYQNTTGYQTLTVKWVTEGDYTVSARSVNFCGAEATGERAYTVVACPLTDINAVVHSTDGLRSPVDVAAPLVWSQTRGDFPTIAINATGSTHPSGIPLTSIFFAVYVVAAPSGSLMAPTNISYSDTSSTSTSTENLGGGILMRSSLALVETKRRLRFARLHVPATFNAWTALFTPDMPGTYELNLVAVAPCGELPDRAATRRFTVTAACAAGAGTAGMLPAEAVVYNAKGEKVTSSIGGGVPTLTLPVGAGSSPAMLNASASFVGTLSGPRLQYYWYWDNSSLSERSALAAPYASTLLLDARMITYNGRVLKVRVTDGCTTAVAAVRIALACTAPTTFKVDKTVIKYDRFAMCTPQVSLDAGACVDHNTWMVSLAESPAQVSAANSFLAAFAAPADDDDSNKKALAIGLGVGIPVAVLLIAGLSFLAYKKGVCSGGTKREPGIETSSRSALGV